MNSEYNRTDFFTVAEIHGDCESVSSIQKEGYVKRFNSFIHRVPNLNG